MTIHTTFPKGKRVHVIMKDGKHFTGKYVEKTSRFVVLTFNGGDKKLAVSDIRSTSIER